MPLSTTLSSQTFTSVNNLPNPINQTTKRDAPQQEILQQLFVNQLSLNPLRPFISVTRNVAGLLALVWRGQITISPVTDLLLWITNPQNQNSNPVELFYNGKSEIFQRINPRIKINPKITQTNLCSCSLIAKRNERVASLL